MGWTAKARPAPLRIVGDALVASRSGCVRGLTAGDHPGAPLLPSGVAIR